MDIWCQLNSSHLWIALYTDETSEQFNNFFLYSFKTARHTKTSNEKFVFMSATTWTWNSPPVIKKKGFKSINRSGEIVAHLIHIISSFTLVTCVHNLMIVTRNYYMPRGLGSRLLSRDLKDKIHSFLPSLFLPSLSSSLALCLSRSLSASIEDNSRCWLLIISNIVNASANENSLLKVKTSHLPNKNNQEQKQERWVRGQRDFRPFLNWSWEKILHQRHVQ